MLSKDFRFSCAYFCFVFWFMNHTINGHGSNLKCCFEVLKNNSVSYQLSEPPGPSCITIWSKGDVVVVDEYGNVDNSTVVHHEAQKLILKENMDEKPKLVTYRKDCQYGYKAECTDPCATGDTPTSTEATHSTAAPSEDNIRSIIAVIGILLFLVIIIIIIVYCKRNRSSTSNCTPRACGPWSEVPQNAVSQV